MFADEIHAAMVLPGAEHTSFLRLSEAAAARGIVLTSASKAFNLAGLGCAQASRRASPPAGGGRSCRGRPRTAAISERSRASPPTAPATSGWTTVNARLDANRGLLGELLAERLPEVGYAEPAAGYLAWLDCRELGLGDDPSATFLERGRVALSPGPQFGPGGEGFARLNYATSPALLELIVERMAAAVGR